MNATELAAVVAVVLTIVGLAGGALYKAGQLSGRFERHETDTDRRFVLLEDANATRITRDELDARFGAMKGQLDTILSLLQKLTATGG